MHRQDNSSSYHNRLSFPLLKLPLIPLREILAYFQLQDIWSLTFCSKKSHRITILALKEKRNVSIWMSVGNRASISVADYGQEDRPYVVGETSKFDELTFFVYENKCLPVNQKCDRMYYNFIKETYQPIIDTFWPERVFGIKSIAVYLTNLLRSPIQQISFLSEMNPHDPIWTIDWIMSRQGSIESCFVNCNSFSDECFIHLLDKLRITRRLHLTSRPSENFCHNCKFELNDLYIKNGFWLTIQDFLASNCEISKIEESKFVSSDINAFLKHWKSGGSSRTKFVQIEMNSFDYAEVSSELDVEEIPETTFRKVPFFYNKMIRIAGGFDVRRNDGTVGTFLRQLVGPETVKFHFHVGPEELPVN